MGKMDEVSLYVEGYSCSGSAKVTKNVLTIENGGTITINLIDVKNNNRLVINHTGNALNISGNTLLNQDYSNMSFVNPIGKVFQLQNVVQNGSTLTLPTSYLPSGTYILRSGNKAVHQFVVNR